MGTGPILACKLYFTSIKLGHYFNNIHEKTDQSNFFPQRNLGFYIKDLPQKQIKFAKSKLKAVRIE